MGIKQWLETLGIRKGTQSSLGAGYHRSQVRNQCLITSEFDYFGNVDTALIKNLNGSGAFIETSQQFTVGEVVQLKFPLHYLDPPIEVKAVVAWVGKEGVGVKFIASEQGLVEIEGTVD